MTGLRADTHEEATVRDPGLAALLSFILPGMGQIYNGTWMVAIFWFIFTPGLWLGTGGFFGWVAHVLAAWFAYRYAKAHPYR
jgi:TM2 domain-containing membrane protein YozV